MSYLDCLIQVLPWVCGFYAFLGLVELLFLDGVITTEALPKLITLIFFMTFLAGSLNWLIRLIF